MALLRQKARSPVTSGFAALLLRFGARQKWRTQPESCLFDVDTAPLALTNPAA